MNKEETKKEISHIAYFNREINKTEWLYPESYVKQLQQENKELKEKLALYTGALKREHEAIHRANDLEERINKAIHRIQLLQMEGEVSIKDLGLILRDLKGEDNE